MNAHNQDELETRLRELHTAANLEAVATLAVRGYGPQIFGFLVATHRTEHDAADVFSLWTEGLWRGLAGFGWGCSFRTWAFVVARNASRRFLRDNRRRGWQGAPLSDCSALSELAAEARSVTVTYLKTQSKSKFAELRETLSDDDRTLLILRIDKEMSWLDVARVFASDDQPESEELLKREAARLRKRFQLVKEQLLEAGRREGLVGAGPENA